jgi:hypothetical protein
MRLKEGITLLYFVMVSDPLRSKGVATPKGRANFGQRLFQTRSMSLQSTACEF